MARSIGSGKWHGLVIILKEAIKASDGNGRDYDYAKEVNFHIACYKNEYLFHASTSYFVLARFALMRSIYPARRVSLISDTI